jgi:hypothetical protein
MSPLDDINPDRWNHEYDNQLLELIAVVERCIELEVSQRYLLDRHGQQGGESRSDRHENQELRSGKPLVVPRERRLTSDRLNGTQLERHAADEQPVALGRVALSAALAQHNLVPGPRRPPERRCSPRCSGRRPTVGRPRGHQRTVNHSSRRRARAAMRVSPIQP